MIRLIQNFFQPKVRGLHTKKKRRRKKALKAWDQTFKGQLYKPNPFLSMIKGHDLTADCLYLETVSDDDPRT